MELNNTIYVFKHKVTADIKYQAVNVCFNKHYKLVAEYQLTNVYY